MIKRLLFVLLVAAPFVYVAWSRYTAYGILAGGGGRYWVSRAVAADVDTESRAHLRRVLGATQYGVNVAENAVRRLPRREDRIRMWRLLVELAPNDHWRETYQRHLDQEATGREPSQSSALPDANPRRAGSEISRLKTHVFLWPHPEPAVPSSLVTIFTEMPRRVGPVGWVEERIVRRLLSRVFAEELNLVATYLARAEAPTPGT